MFVEVVECNAKDIVRVAHLHWRSKNCTTKEFLLLQLLVVTRSSHCPHRKISGVNAIELFYVDSTVSPAGTIIFLSCLTDVLILFYIMSRCVCNGMVRLAFMLLLTRFVTSS